MVYPLSDDAQYVTDAGLHHALHRHDLPPHHSSGPSLDTPVRRASSNDAFSVSPVEHRDSGELRITTQATKSGC